jgi:hypothetical protein
MEVNGACSGGREMSWRRNQRGDVPIGCLIGFLVAVIVAIIAIKVVPVMVQVGEFDKEVKAMADRANRLEYNDKRIQKSLIEKAEDLDLPVNAKSIWIKRSSTRIKIRVTYDYPIEFPGYTYVWHKEHFEDRPLF